MDKATKYRVYYKTADGKRRKKVIKAETADEARKQFIAFGHDEKSIQSVHEVQTDKWKDDFIKTLGKLAKSGTKIVGVLPNGGGEVELNAGDLDPEKLKAELERYKKDCEEFGEPGYDTDFDL